MVMTDGDIITSYRQAKDPKAQLAVLADLNVCSISVMHKKLTALGLNPEPLPPKKEVFPSKKKKPQIDDALARKMVEDFKTEAEIAEAFHVSKYAVQQWKRENKIVVPRNVRQKTPRPKKEKSGVAAFMPEGKLDTLSAFAEVVFKLAQAFPSAMLVRPEHGPVLEIRIYDAKSGAITLFVQ